MAKHAIQLELAEGNIEAFVETPGGPHRLVDLAFQVLGLSSVAAEMGERAAKRNKLSISCTKGCGACCRQLVPISPPEAALIFELVESMNEPQRSTIKERFSLAVDRLEHAGLVDKMEYPDNPLLYKAEEEYFLQGIACPFLENECCGIYSCRPSRCREYLVFTPPEHCANPYQHKIGRLPVTLILTEALTWLWASMVKETPRYIPLVLSMRWTLHNQKTRQIAADPKSMIEVLCRYIENISKSVERETLQKNEKRRMPKIKEIERPL